MDWTRSAFLMPGLTAIEFSRLALTFSAVISVPLWNLTPLRRVKVQFWASLVSHFSASQGRICRVWGSTPTRVSTVPELNMKAVWFWWASVLSAARTVMSLRVLPSVDAWFEGRPQALKIRVTAVSAAASHVAGRLSIVGCSLSLGSGVGWCSGCSTVLPRLLHHDDSARCAERTRDIAAPKLDREARRRREPAVFGLRIALPRHLPGISPSGLLPVSSPSPLRVSPGFSPGSVASETTHHQFAG